MTSSSSDILVALRNIKSHEVVDILRPKIAKLHISFEDIVSATNNFADDSLIKRGSISDVHKGRLCYKEPTDVCIRRFRPSSGIQYFEFLKEVATLSHLNHTNILSFVGFCDDNDEMMMIFKYEDNGSLDRYLDDSNLTWSQRLKICIGVARALRYIHNDIEGHLSLGYHHDIKSSKILLDKDQKAKLFCFGFQINYNVVFHSTSIYKDPSGYSINMGDVYSFGVILFEVLFERKAHITGDDESLVSVATRLYEERKLEDMINPDLRKQMNPLSLPIFSQVAYDCVKKRSRMDLIVKRLHEAYDLLSTHERLEKDYAYMKIPLNDIMLATENFASTYCISSHRGDMMYKADLNHFDINSIFTTEGKNKDDFPKMMYGPVTIIRNIHKDYKQVEKGFVTYIEKLASRKHPNIVSLVGFTWEGYEMILVFESCALHGSLADHLGSIIREKTNLSWKQRIRIGIDIAQGLDYFHKMERVDRSIEIHQLMQTTNVLLDENGNAKIATFRRYRQDYTDEYSIFGLSTEYEIYTLGVVLFEILSGGLGFDSINTYGRLVSMAKRCFKEGTIKNMVDPKIMEEVREHSFILGPDRRSLDAYVNIVHQCLSETKAERPTLKKIISSLNRALTFQEETLEHFKIQLSDIKAATNNFTETYIGEGGYGVVYRADLDVYDKTQNRKRTVAIKRIPGKKVELRNTGFLAELEIISRCEHPNVIRLLGFCLEDSENILIFEYAANGSIDDYLGKGKLSELPWARRLEMCLDIAYGLSYLHTPDGDKKCIIHRDIKSANILSQLPICVVFYFQVKNSNILLGENLEVKIADFGLSIFHPKNRLSSTIYTKRYAGTHMYVDPEYQEGKLKIESDIYSFGVVLFEILSGKLAYDRIYSRENGNGIAAVARQRFRDGKLMEMVDIKIMEEAHELSSKIIIGPSQDSLDEFLEIACKCVAEAQVDRPKMKEVINGLKKAIDFQNNRKDTLEISVENIRVGGENFVDTKCNIEKGYGIYNGEVRYDNETKPVIIKRMSKCCPQPAGSWREFEIPFKHKHENVLGLVGYCKKMNENYIVYEYAVNRSLDMHLGNAKLTWVTRLKIGIDIANGLKFLHEMSDEGQDVVIHRDLKSSNILLTGDWKAKICGFDVSLLHPNNQKVDYTDDGIRGSPGYCDPLYLKTGILTKKSDIYSFGVILFELFCGRLACTGQFLDCLVKDQYDVERPDKLVFDRIRDQIEWESLCTFTKIAFQCLHDDRQQRPTATEVVVQLQRALEFQEAGVWEAKLPTNYRKILEYSESPEIYSTMKNKDIYSILFNGILLQEGKLWFSIGGNGERNEMISARIFSYKNHKSSCRWQTIQDSRFKKVAEMSDVANLNIQIKRGPQLLPPSVNYSIHLVFKFCCPIKSHAKRMYVNLKYKLDNENLNSYFATRRQDGWMMIELGRFSSNKEETNINVLLESFSRCYCDSRAIYIEGIEFRAVDNVKKVDIKKFDKIQHPILKCNSETDEEDAKYVLYGYSKKKLIPIDGSSNSRCRFEGIGIELLRLPVFYIKWKIGTQMVSPNTEHACYLVFRLNENCSGLHCPVIVRNQDRWKSKETIYFRRPSSWNVHETNRIPKERRDGWMEVIVWIYNNSNDKHRNDFLHVNLKLISYEGTMSGLIIRGLEFRPMEE